MKGSQKKEAISACCFGGFLAGSLLIGGIWSYLNLDLKHAGAAFLASWIVGIDLTFWQRKIIRRYLAEQYRKRLLRVNKLSWQGGIISGILGGIGIWAIMSGYWWGILICLLAIAIGGSLYQQAVEIAFEAIGDRGRSKG